MKSILLALAVFVTPSVYAADIQLICTLTTDGVILEEPSLAVTLNEKEISFDADFFGQIQKVTGKFIRAGKSGDLMYDGSDLTEQMDQTDYGYIWVAPALLTGGKGTIGTSVRQLGDSDGAWWFNDSYDCVQK